MNRRSARTALSQRMITFGVVLGLLLTAVGAGLAQSTIQFTAASYSVNEAAGAVTLTVERLNDTNTVVSVDYTTTDGTATNGLKYAAVSGTLTFAASQAQRTIVVPILNDGFADGIKAFRVILSNPAGGVLGTRTSATVSITDNDVGINFRFASYTNAEDVGAAMIGVVRGDDGTLPVTVDVATSDLTATNGLDYTGVSTTLGFAPTERLKFVWVPLLNNSLKQANRTFRLTLSHPTGGALGSTKTTTVTIADNDQGFQFESASYTVAEDSGVALISVLRGSDDTSLPATADYATTDVTATNGVDFTATNGTLSFAAGERTKVVAIPILNDGVNEGTKTFRVTLNNPSGGVLGPRTAATVSILDNDPGVGFAFSSYSVWQKACQIKLTVVRGNDWALGPFTVDYATSDLSGMAGQDYQAVSGALEFQENETVKSLTIPIVQNAAAEGTKTFQVTLSNPSSGATLGTTSTTVSILDNYCTLAPPLDSQLTIRRESAVNILSWTGGGQLQRADRVTGPWQTLATTKSPHIVQPPLAATFYRVAPPRPATLYVPPSYDGHTPMPLVILLHGGGGSGQQVEDWMKLRPLAEARGFLYCYPDAHISPLTGARVWNSTDCCCDPAAELGIPDIADDAYLKCLVEETAQRFAVDRKRVYLVGHSSGAQMSYRMACQYADLIAGIAGLGGPSYLDPGQCAHSEPVNILHIHSIADEKGLYWGGALTIPGGWPFNSLPAPGAVRSVRNWAVQNSAGDPVTDPAPSLDLVQDVAGLDTVITRYTTAPPGGAVELWTITGGPHRPTLSPEFAPRVIEWLLAHPKP